MSFRDKLKIVFFGKLVYSSPKLISQTLTLCLLFQQRILMLHFGTKGEFCTLHESSDNPYLIRECPNCWRPKSQVPWPGDPEHWCVSEGFLRKGLKRGAETWRVEAFQYLRLKITITHVLNVPVERTEGLSMMAYFTVNHLKFWCIEICFMWNSVSNVWESPEGPIRGECNAWSIAESWSWDRVQLEKLKATWGIQLW